MVTEGRSTSSLERFNDKGLAMWKDKLLTHVNHLDQLYKRKQLEKGLPEVHVLMANSLHGAPEKPPPVPKQSKLSEKEPIALRWKVMDWERGRGDLQNLLNQVLPNFFLSTLPDLVSHMDSCDELKALKKHYGQGDAAGLIELTEPGRIWLEASGVI
ncbi:hypothetical protein PC123_g24853 [Phytophthora cactorum]|nr:hypothetical protein PC120_g24328 [Phytophthora cactorum]KAG4039599.1 hypothetical protein PC123_g24853 [Phytophthora cactorum]